jgi:2-methylcitrate dehydratase PrpD
MALAVPAAGGVHRAFGTAAKALQVGFAAQAGVRAAALVAAGADADPRALEQWLALMGVTAPADPSAPDPSASDLSAPDIPGLDLSGPAVPGGLAVKLFPCCYSLQRPITALRGCLGQGVTAAQVRGIRVSCPASAVEPLVFHRPRTGLEAKFSLEYALAATVLDGCPGPASFSTEAVRRPAAVDLMGRVELVTKPGGDGLLAGTTEVELILADGTVRHRAEQIPPGAPARPAGQPELRAKLDRCGSEVPALVEGMTWADASSVLASWPVGAMAS